MALTDAQVRNAKAGKHADGRGLYLQVRKSGTRDWALRIMVNGRRFEMGLGSYPDITLEEARDEATRWRKVAKAGRDPIAERDSERRGRAIRAQTVGDVAVAAFDARKASLKDDGQAGRWFSPLELHVLSKIGGEPVTRVDRHMIVDTLKPIWRDKPATATKAINRLAIVLRHAHALGLDVNPNEVDVARQLLGTVPHEPKHIPAMDWREIPEFYKTLGDDSAGHLALKLLILTALRSTPVRLARWEQLTGIEHCEAGGHGIWLIPAANMKGLRGKTKDFELIIPREAMSIMHKAERRAQGEWLFAGYGGGPIGDMTLTRILDRRGIKARPHGFRSSFSTWAAETGKDPMVVEAALAHEIGNKVARAYRRTSLLEPRKRLLDDWAHFVTKA